MATRRGAGSSLNCIQVQNSPLSPGCQVALNGWVYSLSPDLSGSSPASVTHRRWRRKAEQAAAAAAGRGGAGGTSNRSVQSSVALRLFNTTRHLTLPNRKRQFQKTARFQLQRHHTLVTTSSHFRAKCLMSGWDYCRGL